MNVLFWILAIAVVGFIGYKAYKSFTKKSDSGDSNGGGNVVVGPGVEEGPDEGKPQK